MRLIREISGSRGYGRTLWHELAAMDVALLREICGPPGELPSHVEPGSSDLWTCWEKESQPMVVKQSDRIEIDRVTRIRPFVVWVPMRWPYAVSGPWPV